jgi:hypothetical protein
MSNERVRELLQQLRQELDKSQVDSKTLSLMRELDSDIKKVLESSAAAPPSLTDRAKSLEVEFAAKHGSAERILRQIIDTLGKMGV